MSQKKLISITAVITFVITCAANYFLPVNLKYNPDKVSEVQAIIEKKYNGKYDKEKLENYASYALVSALDDPYSEYLDKEDYKLFMESMDATYEGVGLEVYIDSADNLLTVLAPLEGGPAAEAGILPGDKIIKIDSMDVTADNYNDVIRYMRGLSEEGKKVSEMAFTVNRSGQTLSFKLKRRKIEIKTVSFADYGDIAYIRISSFDIPTSEELAAVLSSIDTEKTKGLVIDLRDNPGGLLTSAVTIADFLMGEADIVTVEYKTGKNQHFSSDSSALGLPFAIIVNGSSASASEILAGAVKDNRAGKIVGTKTFGKGCVQEIIPLHDEETAVKLTTALYYTPNGVCIHEKGIEPDIVVELPEELETKSVKRLTFEEDIQLQKAMATVRAQYK